MRASHRPRFAVSVGRYFFGVSLLTLILGIYILSQNIEVRQVIQEQLGILEYLKASDESFYVHRVDPIFERYCVSCHQKNKAKGKLRLETYRQVKFGGKSGDVLLGGRDSVLLDRMLLPSHEPFAMPPYGRDRPSVDELKVIELWLQRGASGSMTAEHFADAPEQEVEIHFETIHWGRIKYARKKYAQAVYAFQVRYPMCLDYQAQTSSLLVFSDFNLDITELNVALENLKDLSENIAELYLTQMASLANLHTRISFFKNLQILDIKGHRVTKELVNVLEQLSHLQRVMIDQNKISPEDLNRLRASGINIISVSPTL